MTHCAPVQVVSAVRHHLGYLSPMEAEMRTIISTFVGLVDLAAVSAGSRSSSAGQSPATELGVAPPIELVAQGCGPGWHRHPLARLLGSLALGEARPELVTR